LRGAHAALSLYQDARGEMAKLTAARHRLTFLTDQALHGKTVEGGRGLGTGDARGSEPWWMREPAYGARRAIEHTREEIARRRAQVASLLAIARSQVDANVADAGETGESAQRRIYAGAAAWHMGEWRQGIAQGDAERAALHRFAVEQLDPEPYRAELSGVREVRIRVARPAPAWLFRYEREGDVVARGGPRLIPLPYHPARGLGSVPASYEKAVAARLEGEGRRPVERDVATLSRPLHSTEQYVDTLGGRMRRARYERLLERSAYPLTADEGNALGTIEGERVLGLPPGRYLLLLRPPGHAALRVPFEIGDRKPADIVVGRGLDLTEAPPGFVLVPRGRVRAGEEEARAPGETVEVDAFLAARYEVTYADYWEFLGDERTIRLIDEHSDRELRFVPRSGGTVEEPGGTALPMRPPGLVRYLPMDNPEQPVGNLNLYDLVGYLTPPPGEDGPSDDQYRRLAADLSASRTVGWGYLRWRTQRSRARAAQAARTGERLEDVAWVRAPDGSPKPHAILFALPGEEEWERMARGGDRRIYVYGDEREWSYFKGMRSRRHYAAPEAVGLFADDESVFGVRDLTGSLAEWTSGWRESGGVFVVKGHSWGSQRAEDTRIAARGALAPHVVSSTVGVRLVVRRLEPASP
jgi:formylglycine-generating enzyme required for sulfatase activity